jgi:hypothetical protein
MKMKSKPLLPIDWKDWKLLYEKIETESRTPALWSAVACYRLGLAKLASPVEFGHFADKETRVPVTRAEGPAESSHARQGVGCGTDGFEGRRPGTKPVPHLRRSFLTRRPIPGLTAGPTHCRPFGPTPPLRAELGEACFARVRKTDHIHEHVHVNVDVDVVVRVLVVVC